MYLLREVTRKGEKAMSAIYKCRNCGYIEDTGDYKRNVSVIVYGMICPHCGIRSWEKVIGGETNNGI